MTQMIVSKSNTIVKYVSSLHKKKARWKDKKFFIEGIRSVEECINSKGLIQQVLYSDSLFDTDRGSNLFEEIKNKYKTYHVEDKILKNISDTENPQGIIAVVGFFLDSLDDIIKDKNNFIVILDRVQDPGNVGTIIRTADAFGASGIIVTNGCVDIYNPKTIRSTMGSIFHVPITFTDDIISTISELKKKNIKIISTSLSAQKFNYDLDYNKEFALVVGNEAFGVSDEVLSHSDYTMKIPMSGRAESLNAAIATGVVMYEVFKQRQILE